MRLPDYKHSSIPNNQLKSQVIQRITENTKRIWDAVGIKDLLLRRLIANGKKHTCSSSPKFQLNIKSHLTNKKNPTVLIEPSVVFWHILNEGSSLTTWNSHLLTVSDCCSFCKCFQHLWAISSCPRILMIHFHWAIRRAESMRASRGKDMPC